RRIRIDPRVVSVLPPQGRGPRRAAKREADEAAGERRALVAQERLEPRQSRALEDLQVQVIRQNEDDVGLRGEGGRDLRVLGQIGASGEEDEQRQRGYGPAERFHGFLAVESVCPRR